jgi:hypothetical protein
MARENERLLRVSIEDRDYMKKLSENRGETLKVTTAWLIDQHRKIGGA